MEVDPEQRPERISVRGMGGWALTKLNNRPFRATDMPLPPPPHQTPLSISRENTLQTSGRRFYGKRGAHDGAVCIYNLAYINWCESRAICHIPALNQLPWNILASLNRDRRRQKNQQHIRSNKLANGRLVWHLIHTLL